MEGSSGVHTHAYTHSLIITSNVKTVGGYVAAGFPVFLFPALLDHVMSLLSYGVTRCNSWSDSHEVTTFLMLDNVYILVCTDCSVLSDVYIPLVVRIGLFRPNKRQFTSGLHLTG